MWKRSSPPLVTEVRVARVRGGSTNLPKLIATGPRCGMVYSILYGIVYNTVRYAKLPIWAFRRIYMVMCCYQPPGCLVHMRGMPTKLRCAVSQMYFSVLCSAGASGQRRTWPGQSAAQQRTLY
jgi:hypothetical protein